MRMLLRMVMWKYYSGLDLSQSLVLGMSIPRIYHVSGGYLVKSLTKSLMRNFEDLVGQIFEEIFFRSL